MSFSRTNVNQLLQGLPESAFGTNNVLRKNWLLFALDVDSDPKDKHPLLFYAGTARALGCRGRFCLPPRERAGCQIVRMLMQCSSSSETSNRGFTSMFHKEVSHRRHNEASHRGFTQRLLHTEASHRGVTQRHHTEVAHRLRTEALQRGLYSVHVCFIKRLQAEASGSHG